MLFYTYPPSASTGAGHIYGRCGSGKLQDLGLQSGIFPQDPNEEVGTSPLCLVTFPCPKERQSGNGTVCICMYMYIDACTGSEGFAFLHLQY